jgi:hypothetical protein
MGKGRRGVSLFVGYAAVGQEYVRLKASQDVALPVVLP